MDKWGIWKEQMMWRKFLTADNPVLKAMMTLPPGQGISALQQYCSLVHMIVVYLGFGVEQIPVRTVADELRRNIAEEQGSRTNGIPHREILGRLFREEFKAETFAPWSLTTRRFHMALFSKFQHEQNPRFIAGMIYALEATACAELQVVAEIINCFAGYTAIDLKSSAEPTTLSGFFAMHINDFEVGHESKLREALEDYISEDWRMFTEGFSFVLDHMESWWDGLASEVYQNL